LPTAQQLASDKSQRRGMDCPEADKPTKKMKTKQILFGLYISFVYMMLIASMTVGFYISLRYAHDFGMLLVAINIFIFYKFTSQII
jgi:hypothetical protein